MPYAQAGDIQLYYEEHGSGDPLILIMGLGAPGSRWEEHLAAYQQHFRCVAFDNRGAGASDKPPGPYTTAMMAEDTAALMRALGIDRARVAGISMGSAIAQELALAHPEMVQCLVLVASWSRCDLYMTAVFEHFRKMRAVASPADFVQLLQLWIFTPAYYEAHYEEMLQAQRDALVDYMPLHAYEAQCHACATHNTYDRLPAISAATLLTSGDSDIFTPLRLSEEMHQRIPNSELLVIPNAGHCHHWEDLETFNRKTTEFLLAN